MTILLIAAMGIVTFLLRFTPLLLAKKVPIEGKSNGFLDNLPLAVLSSLTIPGIFQVDAETPWVGIAAGLTAVLLVCIRKVPLFLVIVASVLAALLVKMI
ncbi:AzlD domain-containing protein [Paenibacillus sp. URB8-2]|uniref:AzlD domain-containing protein n=1 Tax=Paenibacillus sp. URB8-2 TaxID=2741301 RepID=UPI0015C255AB|nr:AzlD domain-containing protein [Paenibacillus sp. URB8-2]BCG56867.1 hypothetical protein PUR_02920 [Paenibacillus sp. URB8-2]